MNVHRHHNGLRTALLLGLLSVLILVVGYWIGGASGLVIALVIALAMNAVTYFWSDKIALRSMAARPVSEAQAPWLYAMVRELSSKAGKPMPRLYISPASQPNAFATGRNPDNAAVCVTEGITQMLNQRELRAVIGHELSHVYNRDILISCVAAALGSMITALVYLAWFIPFGRSDDDDGPGIFGFLAILLLGPIAASLIQLAISRSREYEADADGARLSDDPLALASALHKIDTGARSMPLQPTSQLQSSAHLMIANPLRPSGVSKLFSTHPPMADRIKRLEEMATSGEPYIRR